jgi:hypothetical protein
MIFCALALFAAANCADDVVGVVLELMLVAMAAFKSSVVCDRCQRKKLERLIDVVEKREL